MGKYLTLYIFIFHNHSEIILSSARKVTLTWYVSQATVKSFINFTLISGMNSPKYSFSVKGKYENNCINSHDNNLLMLTILRKQILANEYLLVNRY